MSIKVAVGGKYADGSGAVVLDLVQNHVASRLSQQDPTLWGPAAEAEASIRLGWIDAASVSRPLVAEILGLRDHFAAAGISHYILCGMGGSSLAPEVITRTAEVQLTVLDSTSPQQVDDAFVDAEHSVVIVSSKSGSTVETDSHKRTAEKWFADAGIDPVDRIVIVTDPGSPLDVSARTAGYRVFNADPNVGGRFSALTAFGLVPSGLAGADISALLDEADATARELALDDDNNPAIVLAAALSCFAPAKDKIGLLPRTTEIVGFPDWAEQLIAESLGKEGTGLLPVVLGDSAPELDSLPDDMTLVTLVPDALVPQAGTIKVSGSLGEQMYLWEFAISLVGRVLGINPFDQPDVESAKAATRALLADKPAPTPAALTDDGIEIRGTDSIVAGASSLDDAVAALLAQLDSQNGYLAIQAYVDRPDNPGVPRLRDIAAEVTGRPVTFGWGPRFLHSTGQYHKGGPAEGVFLQLVERPTTDREIPGLPFSFGELIVAQAAGDASVLAQHDRPVLSLTLDSVDAGVDAIVRALRSSAS